MTKTKDLHIDPKPSNKPILLTIAELADYLKVSKWTLQDWRAKGTGPKYIRVNNVKKYYRLEDVVDWLDQHTLTSSSDKGGCA